MKLLLDTHILLWALTDDPRLSSTARALIFDSGNIICYSSASLWEISIKHGLHPESVPFTAKEVDGYCRSAGYIQIPVSASHVFALETLERAEDAPKHNAPFDRIMLSQAKAENMRFMTHDHLIPYYNEPCVEAVQPVSDASASNAVDRTAEK